MRGSTRAPDAAHTSPAMTTSAPRWMVAIACAALSCEREPRPRAGESDVVLSTPGVDPPLGERVALSAPEWRRRLSADQYQVMRQRGTERAFTGDYWDHHERGTYLCAACGAPLFSSETKYNSGTGWPSFWQPVDPRRIELARDGLFDWRRNEVRCARCGGHLGHVFSDGPPPTGLRYCIDSVSLSFRPAP